MKIIAVKVFHQWYSCYIKRLQVSTRAVKIQWNPCLLKGEKFKRTRTVFQPALLLQWRKQFDLLTDVINFEHHSLKSLVDYFLVIENNMTFTEDVLS